MHTTPLMLLPGLLCDEAVWQDQVAVLGKTRECLIADYGEADSLAAMADVALAKAPPQFALAGHSMGGRVALEVMRKAPERISHFALLDTGYEGRPNGPAGERERDKRLALVERARTQGMRAMGDQWLIGMVLPDNLNIPGLKDSILAMIERKAQTTYEAQIRALLARPDATGLLARINCPTEVICARFDEWSPLSRHQRMAEQIPGSHLTIIEDSGHMCTMEQPEQVTIALQKWLSRSE